MTTKIDIVLANAALPKLTSYGQTLAALPGLTEWWQAQDEFVDLVAGQIATWHGRKTSGLTLTQDNQAERASLDANQINGWPAATFVGANLDRYLFPTSVGLSGTLALAIVVNLTSRTSGASEGLISSITDNANRFGLVLDPATANKAYGFCGNAAFVTPELDVGTWTVVIIEKNAATVQVRSGGINSPDTAHNNATGTSQLTLGAYSVLAQPSMSAKVADIFLFNQRIIGDSTVMGALNGYTTALYGVGA